MSSHESGLGQESGSLHESVIHDRHVALGAKFAEFGGWSMPLEYAGGGVLAEHQAVREGVGIFDVSHLGKALVAGPGAKEALNRIVSNDLGKIGVGKAQYNLLLNDDAGIIDDFICYLRGDDEVFIIPNAANCATVCEVIADHLPDGVTITNQHFDYAVFAVQGPKSPDVLAAMGLPTELEYMAFETVDKGMTVCRTGYTGEKGYELVVSVDHAGEVWDAAVAAGEPFAIRPAGLAARDTLRTEMGYSLHGNDISPEINPVEAGLNWAVGWAKPEFLGREVATSVKEQGPARRSRALKATGRGIPRHGMTVVDLASGEPIGEVTSGTFSPTLRQGIALALIKPEYKAGGTVGVQVRNRVEEFDVIKLPFVQTDVRD